MIDMMKVINALNICLGHGNCMDCGYKVKGCYSTMDCRKPMMRDALALIKDRNQRIWELIVENDRLKDLLREKETK